MWKENVDEINSRLQKNRSGLKKRLSKQNVIPGIEKNIS